jgi:glycosyltransferase involved in cell wall biosynthesis
LNLKITIITATFNSEKHLRQTLLSISNQLYKNIEHIIIDGGSSDNTLSICKEFSHVTKIISEKDNGIYDALNKGLKIATGDIIGFLHSDDYLNNELVLLEIANQFHNNPNLDATISDIVFINKLENKIIRNYSSKNWTPKLFAWGKMPPHPAVFCKYSVYKNLFFDTSFKIAADYDILIKIFYKNKIKYKYLPLITTVMRFGGMSTKGLNSNLLINKEVLMACKNNNIYTNRFMLFFKYIFKIFELI